MRIHILNIITEIKFKIYFSHNIVINETNSCFDSTFSIILIKKKKNTEKIYFLTQLSFQKLSLIFTKMTRKNN